MQKKKKILFLHGFYASGSCVPALALKEAFEDKAVVLTPDLPLHPHDAIRLIQNICDKEKPDILVGNSCGSFYAQMISPVIGVPALLGNPHFKMSDFLRERIGSHQYKSPRADGNQDFTITENIRNAYGGSLVRRTRWLTLSRCSWNIISIHTTSPVDTHLLQNSSRLGIVRSSRK